LNSFTVFLVGMKQIGGVFGKRGKGIGAKSGAAAEIGRKVSANEFAGETESLDVVIFESESVEAA
jgi:hypothetical protein